LSVNVRQTSWSKKIQARLKLNLRDSFRDILEFFREFIGHFYPEIYLFLINIDEKL